jgi:hypothetical protein
MLSLKQISQVKRRRPLPIHIIPDQALTDLFNLVLSTLARSFLVVLGLADQVCPLFLLVYFNEENVKDLFQLFNLICYSRFDMVLISF